MRHAAPGDKPASADPVRAGERRQTMTRFLVALVISGSAAGTVAIVATAGGAPASPVVSGVPGSSASTSGVSTAGLAPSIQPSVAGAP